MARSLAHRRGTHESAHLMEPLESRQLLTADLGVVFDDFSNAPLTLIPGDQIAIPIIVRNVGNSAAVGAVTIDFFLSTNATFDAGDTLLRTFANQQVSLSADGFDNSEGTFEGTVTIPTINPGTFFFLVRLRPNSQIGDFNQSNNTAASEDTQAFAWKFGSFDNRTNATLTLTDPSGTEVSFGLSGGGFGTVTRDGTNAERFDVALSNTGGASAFAIEADGGSGATAGIGLIDDITGGSLASITAPTARLFGDVTLTGTLGSMNFRDVVGPSIIRVQTGTTNTSYTFGAVTDLSIQSVAPISSLSVASWTDSSLDSTVDLISTPWLGTLTSTGSFQASIQLSGRAGNARTLGSATIGGTASKGSWDINGRSGPISIRAGATDFSISILKALSGFTVTGIFRSVLAAKSISNLSIGVNLRSATILAGADLGADARLGGTGANADSFALGNISNINVGGKVLASTIGAGLDPVDGIFGNGNDRIIAGKITNITIARTASLNSRFLAKRYTGTAKINGASVDTVTDVRFRLPDTSAPFAGVESLDPAGAPTSIRVSFTDNIGINVSSIGAGDFTLTGPNGFTTTLNFVSIELPGGNGTPRFALYAITPPGGSWDSSDNGNYEIVANPNQVFDTSGNPLPAESILEFTINI